MVRKGLGTSDRALPCHGKGCEFSRLFPADKDPTHRSALRRKDMKHGRRILWYGVNRVAYMILTVNHHMQLRIMDSKMPTREYE
jgi:hypothetical protein